MSAFRLQPDLHKSADGLLTDTLQALTSRDSSKTPAAGTTGDYGSEAAITKRHAD
jgi:hypothetical protein